MNRASATANSPTGSMTRNSLRCASPSRCGVYTACIALLIASTAGRLLAADLSKDILTASDVTPYTATIQGYIVSQVKGLTDPDPTKASKTRQSLIDEMAGLNPPSAAFSDFYCGELTNQLTPLTGNSDPRVRLNVAIVTARVAERAQDASGRLAPLIVAELKDTNAGVVLWAMRAARNTIAPILNVKGANNLLVPAILAAAKATSSGAVVGAAYDALASTGPNPASLQVNVSATIQLLNYRLAQYSNGIPSEPPMDGRATAFLTQRNVWSVQTPPQQLVLVQTILDLIGAANGAYQSAQGIDRDELVSLLSGAGEALFVVGINKQDALLQSAVTPLSQANSRMSPAALLANVNAAEAGVLSSYPKAHRPSTMASTTSPTSKPAVK